MEISSIQMIRARREQIARETAEHQGVMAERQQAISDLAVEDRELIVAERVLARLSGQEVEVPAQGIVRELSPVAAAKPPNIPSMPDMIMAAIKDGYSKGQRGLEPKDMVAHIALQWWPEVPPTSVGPIAWRMSKDGRLAKDPERPIYFLPNEEAPAGDTAGASEPGGASTPSLFSSRPNDTGH